MERVTVRPLVNSRARAKIYRDILEKGKSQMTRRGVKMIFETSELLKADNSFAVIWRARIAGLWHNGHAESVSHAVTLIERQLEGRAGPVGLAS